MKIASFVAVAAFCLGAAAVTSASAQEPESERRFGHRGPGPMGHMGRMGQMRGGSHGMSMLNAADANGDFSVTQEEVNELRAEMFDWLDRTGDGVFDDADRSPVARRLIAKAEPDEETPFRGRDHFTEFDANDDGAVTRAEFLDAPSPMFGEMDENDDGVIEPSEMDAAVERREGRRRWWRSE